MKRGSLLWRESLAYGAFIFLFFVFFNERTTLDVFAVDSGALLQRAVLTFNRQEQGPHMLGETTSANRNLHTTLQDNGWDHPQRLPEGAGGRRGREPAVPEDRAEIKMLIACLCCQEKKLLGFAKPKHRGGDNKVLSAAPGGRRVAAFKVDFSI